MTRNTLSDLNDHLFAELERLGDEGMTPEAMRAEIERAKALSSIAKQVVANANVVLRAAEFADEQIGDAPVPAMLGVSERPMVGAPR